MFGGRWSMRLGTVLGFPVEIHLSLLLVMGVMFLAQPIPGLMGAIQFVMAAIILFGSVLAHELGHSVVARSRGVHIAKITLYPFGGVAHMDGLPSSPRDEMLIAAAGPAVSLALFGGASIMSMLLPGVGILAAFLQYVANINMMLGLFNLVPALPMDGGRILRAWLATRLGFLAATLLAVRIARLFGWGMIAAGLIWGWASMAVIGFLLLMMSRQEEVMARLGGTGYRTRDQGFWGQWGPRVADFRWNGTSWVPHDDPVVVMVRRPDGVYVIERRR